MTACRIIIFFLILNPFILSAQVKELDTIVVSVSLQAQQEKETGRNIITIKGSELQRLPVNGIDDILKYLPGLEVQQRGPQGSQADILIRGGTFQQVLVLIDGVRLNDPLTGHFNGYIPLHFSEIERIEVLKGAAASVHGSDAIGGVVNILTKAGTHSTQEQRNAFSGGMEVGQFGLFNMNAWWRMRTEKSSVSIGGFSQNATGEALRGTTGYFHNSSASVGISHSFNNEWKMSFRSSADIRDFNAQNYYTTFKSDTAKEKVTSFWQQLHISRNGIRRVFNFDAAYKNLEDNYRFRPGASPNENSTRLFVSQAYATFRKDKPTTLTAGLQYIYKDIRSNDRGDHSLPHAAAYMIATHRFKNDIHLNESIRLDWDGNYGTEIVPQLNFSWSPSRVTFRASVGKGIRDADFTERFNNFNKPLVTSGSIGNPDLKPERSWSYEAGMDYRIMPWLKIGGTIFQRNQRNLIDWTPTPFAQMPNQANLVPNGNYALATNLETVDTRGLELDIRMARSFRKDQRLLFFSGLLWMNSENDKSIPSFYISSHARFLLNSILSFQTGNLDLSVNTVFKKRRQMEATAINAKISERYFLANLKIQYRIPQLKTGIFIQAYNLTDRKYSDLLGAMMPGRWFTGGFQVTL